MVFIDVLFSCETASFKKISKSVQRYKEILG
jgi:hypothetical protein